MTFTIWTAMGIITVIGLIIFYKKPYGWGGLFLGAFVGCVISIISMDKGGGFQFIPIRRAAVAGALAGIIVSLVTRIMNKKKGSMSEHRPETGAAHNR